MVAFSRPLSLSLALMHGTALAVYLWRLIGKGKGVRSYRVIVCSFSTFLAASLVVLKATKGTTQYIGLMASPVFSILHLGYFVRPAYVDYKRKAVLITGCDSGFGRRLAIRLDKMGLHVFAGCQFPSEKGAKHLVALASSTLQIVQLDITDERSLENALQFVTHNLKDDEVFWALVNNAGIYKYYGELDLVPMECIEKMMAVNYLGSVRTTKAFLSLLRRNAGRIVNVSSATGVVPLPHLGPYSSTKAALEAITETLRDEMSKWNVSVSLIRPGPYDLVEHQSQRSVEEDYLDFLWLNLPNDTREDYGRDYLNGYLSAPSFSLRKEPTQVIDALEDAVMSRCPQKVYNTGRKTVWCIFLHRLLPSCWKRCPYMIRQFTFHVKATPQAIRNAVSHEGT